MHHMQIYQAHGKKLPMEEVSHMYHVCNIYPMSSYIFDVNFTEPHLTPGHLYLSAANIMLKEPFCNCGSAIVTETKYDKIILLIEQ